MHQSIDFVKWIPMVVVPCSGDAILGQKRTTVVRFTDFSSILLYLVDLLYPLYLRSAILRRSRKLIFSPASLLSLAFQRFIG